MGLFRPYFYFHFCLEITADLPDSSIPPREAPWQAGWRAIRANFWPALVVQAFMFATVLVYFTAPASHVAFDALATLKEHWGYAYSAIAAVIAGAIIPEALRIIVFQRGRPARRNLGNLLFAACFWGCAGMQVDLLYRLQGLWFGNEPSFVVVLKKILVDQFLYCPLIACPQSVILYDWGRTGFSRHELSGYFTLSFYRSAIIPTLLATWGVWIPVVAAVYSLPGSLQIPLFSLALSLWVILFTWMSEQRTS